MSTMVKSSVVVLLSHAADETRERPGNLTLNECVGLALLAGAFGQDRFVRIFAEAGWRRVAVDLESGG